MGLSKCNNVLLATAVGWAMHLSAAQATEPGHFTPASVKVCTSGEVVTCKTAYLPRETGRVTSVIGGNWVSPVAASGSWLAITKQHASLCYMGSLTTSVECFPIAAYAPDGDAEFLDIGSGVRLLTFAQRADSTQATVDFYRSVKIFTRHLDVTAKEVQQHAASAYNAAAQERATLGPANRRGDKPALKKIDNHGGCGGACAEIGSGGSYVSGSEATWEPIQSNWDYDSSTTQPAFVAPEAPPAPSDDWNFPRVFITAPEQEPEAQENHFPNFGHMLQDPLLIPPDVPPSGDIPPEVTTVSNATTCR